MVYIKQELLALILNMVLYYGVQCSGSCSIKQSHFLFSICGLPEITVLVNGISGSLNWSSICYCWILMKSYMKCGFFFLVTDASLNFRLWTVSHNFCFYQCSLAFTSRSQNWIALETVCWFIFFKNVVRNTVVVSFQLQRKIHGESFFKMFVWCPL